MIGSELSGIRRMAGRFACICAVLLAVALSVATPAMAQCPELDGVRLVASDGAGLDGFGIAVDVSGGTVLVGTRLGDGIVADAGAAYVFGHDGTQWTERTKLVANDGASLDFFGSAVAIDGEVAVVGAPYDDDLGPDSGAVYVFRRVGGVWLQEQKLAASDGGPSGIFGSTVAVSDGVVFVGAPNDSSTRIGAGAAYVFRYVGKRWLEEAKLVSTAVSDYDQFGADLDASGPVVIVGAPAKDVGGRINSGAVSVFRYDGSAWLLERELAASDAGNSHGFGRKVAIDGDDVLVGAPSADGVAPDTGAAYYYRYSSGNWFEIERIAPSDSAGGDYFGFDLDLHAGLAMIGSGTPINDVERGGAAYVFQLAGSSWIEGRKYQLANPSGLDGFGSALAVDGPLAIAGAPGDDVGSGQDAGSATVIRLDEAPTCLAGTVDLGGGTGTADVLRVVEFPTDCVDRYVRIPTSTTFDVVMDAPPAGPQPAPFVLYAWNIVAKGGTDAMLPLGVGTLCFPTYAGGQPPQPIAIWNNVGHRPYLGKPNYASQPAPSTVVRVRGGVSTPISLTLQGIILDDGSAASVPASVTNGVVLVFE